MADKTRFLHLFKNEKFTDPYIGFIHKHFNANEHLFLIVGGVSEKRIKITKRTNVIRICNVIDILLVLIKALYRCERIYLHGLFMPLIVLILFLQPWLLKKCNWLIWGGDLYWYKNRPSGIKSNIYESARRFVIKRIGGLITHIKGDYELAKLWYGARGKYYYSFMYPSNLYKEYDLSSVKKKPSITYIQVGNSADPANNHLEIFEKLKVYKDNEIKIICPLSYGVSQYRDNVIKTGQMIFGEKFKAITEFMLIEQYIHLLAKVDVAIFNHKRQQAMGNITTLLGLGKKVYIREEITTWDFCKEHDLKVFSANGDLEDLFEEIDELTKKKNVDNVKSEFSIDKLVKDLRIIF